MLPGLATQTITRIRPTVVTDDRGNQVDDWDDASSVAVKGCSVQPGTSREELSNRDGVNVIYTVYAPPTADVHAGDAVDLPQGRFQVEGEPQEWAIGALAHTVIQLSRWAG
jgi:hypothetical protein